MKGDIFDYVMLVIALYFASLIIVTLSVIMASFLVDVLMEHISISKFWSEILVFIFFVIIIVIIVHVLWGEKENEACKI